MQLPCQWACTLLAFDTFQSSSSQKAGCNLVFADGYEDPLRSCFNPHPARRPDATTPCRQFRPRSNDGACFNPHPARRPDATLSSVASGRSCGHGIGFQSSSSQKAGCNRSANRHSHQPRLVSILIQPEGRMQLASILVNHTYRVMFQSSSSQKAGCNPKAGSLTLPSCMFQSSSSQKAGCNARGHSRSMVECCFNPHPARRPDATCYGPLPR